MLSTFKADTLFDNSSHDMEHLMNVQQMLSHSFADDKQISWSRRSSSAEICL